MRSSRRTAPTSRSRRPTRSSSTCPSTIRHRPMARGPIRRTGRIISGPRRGCPPISWWAPWASASASASSIRCGTGAIGTGAITTCASTRRAMPRSSPDHAAPASTTWQHDPAHRRGVPYRDAKSRTAYQRPVAAAAARDAPAIPLLSRAVVGARARACATRAGAASAPAQRAAPQRMAQPPQPPTPQVQPPTAHANPLQPPAARTAPVPAARTAPVPAATQRPTAFQPVSRGPDVQAQAQRGAASRQSPPAPIAVAHPAPPPAAHPAPPPAAHPAPPPAAHPAPPRHPAPANPQERKP